MKLFFAGLLGLYGWTLLEEYQAKTAEKKKEETNLRIPHPDRVVFGGPRPITSGVIPTGEEFLRSTPGGSLLFNLFDRPKHVFTVEEIRRLYGPFPDQGPVFRQQTGGYQ